MKRGRARHSNVKGIADLDDTQKLMKARFGDDVELRMPLEMYAALHLGIGQLREICREFEGQSDFIDYFLQNHVVYPLDDCLRSGDATYFRQLADAIEAVQQGPANSVRTFLHRCFITGRTRDQWKLSEIRQLLIQEKVVTDISRQGLAKICTELGIAVMPDKGGRPRSNRNR